MSVLYFFENCCEISGHSVSLDHFENQTGPEMGIMSLQTSPIRSPHSNCRRAWSLSRSSGPYKPPRCYDSAQKGDNDPQECLLLMESTVDGPSVYTESFSHSILHSNYSIVKNGYYNAFMEIDTCKGLNLILWMLAGVPVCPYVCERKVCYWMTS